MMTSFLDPQWRNTVVNLLGAINATLARPTYLRPKSIPEERDLPNIGAALASGNYRPDDWFQPGAALEPPAWHMDTPRIEIQSDYRLLALSALQATVSRISVRFGGVVFEDPFYALLACFNVGSRHKLLALPQVSSADQAWNQRSSIVQSLTTGAYRPEKLFFECAPESANPTGLPLRSLTVRGDLLQQFHQLGGGSLQDEGGFSRYALYEFVPEK